MKKIFKALFITAAVCGAFAVSPAAAAQKAAANDYQADTYTARGTTGVLALDNLHENGSTCMTCSNGIYGTSGTHNMRSNEY